MRKRPTDVITREIDGKLFIDLPKGVNCYTLSDGTLRAMIDTPAGEPALRSIVDSVGRPLVVTRIICKGVQRDHRQN
jgi:hypothetical protein